MSINELKLEYYGLDVLIGVGTFVKLRNILANKQAFINVKN